MARRLSPQRAELYRLREYGRKVRTLQRGRARAAKLLVVSVSGKRGGK